MNQGKEPRMEMQADFELISNRTLLVLYFTCVRHPYFFPLLRLLCKALHDDKELDDLRVTKLSCLSKSLLKKCNFQIVNMTT